MKYFLTSTYLQLSITVYACKGTNNIITTVPHWSQNFTGPERCIDVSSPNTMIIQLFSLLFCQVTRIYIYLTEQSFISLSQKHEYSLDQNILEPFVKKMCFVLCAMMHNIMHRELLNTSSEVELVPFRGLFSTILQKLYKQIKNSS